MWGGSYEPDRQPKWGDFNYEEHLRSKYHEIRNAHLAYRTPSLTERDEALKRGDAFPEMLEYMDSFKHPGAHFGFPFGHPTGEHALFAVAVLRRVGYGVTLHVDCDFDESTIQLNRSGFQVPHPKNKAKGDYIAYAAKHNFELEVSLPGTGPVQLGRRGAIWCIPRFKMWAKRTKEHMYAPGGNGARHAAKRFAARASQ